MADEGKNYISTEACDVLDSVSFLSLEGKPSPLESTVLPNTEEQQVWIGFTRCLLVMLGCFFVDLGFFLGFSKLFFGKNCCTLPKYVFDSSAYFSLLTHKS